MLWSIGLDFGVRLDPTQSQKIRDFVSALPTESSSSYLTRIQGRLRQLGHSIPQPTQVRSRGRMAKSTRYETDESPRDFRADLDV